MLTISRQLIFSSFFLLNVCYSINWSTNRQQCAAETRADELFIRPRVKCIIIWSAVLLFKIKTYCHWLCLSSIILTCPSNVPTQNVRVGILKNFSIYSNVHLWTFCKTSKLLYPPLSLLARTCVSARNSLAFRAIVLWSFTWLMIFLFKQISYSSISLSHVPRKTVRWEIRVCCCEQKGGQSWGWGLKFTLEKTRNLIKIRYFVVENWLAGWCCCRWISQNYLSPHGGRGRENVKNLNSNYCAHRVWWNIVQLTIAHQATNKFTLSLSRAKSLRCCCTKLQEESSIAFCIGCVQSLKHQQQQLIEFVLTFRSILWDAAIERKSFN